MTLITMAACCQEGIRAANWPTAIDAERLKRALDAGTVLGLAVAMLRSDIPQAWFLPPEGLSAPPGFTSKSGGGDAEPQELAGPCCTRTRLARFDGVRRGRPFSDRPGSSRRNPTLLAPRKRRFAEPEASPGGERLRDAAVGI